MIVFHEKKTAPKKLKWRFFAPGRPRTAARCCTPSSCEPAPRFWRCHSFFSRDYTKRSSFAKTGFGQTQKRTSIICQDRPRIKFKKQSIRKLEHLLSPRVLPGLDQHLLVVIHFGRCRSTLDARACEHPPLFCVTTVFLISVPSLSWQITVSL
eukprot:COSAG06_NODE_17728_length_924_cov_1.991515_2_plen_153_part_00